MTEEFLKLLACPKCDSRPPLRLEGEWLICTQCEFGYPIIDDIPHLLIDEAVSPEERGVHARAD